MSWRHITKILNWQKCKILKKKSKNNFWVEAFCLGSAIIIFINFWEMITFFLLNILKIFDDRMFCTRKKILKILTQIWTS